MFHLRQSPHVFWITCVLGEASVTAVGVSGGVVGGVVGWGWEDEVRHGWMNDSLLKWASAASRQVRSTTVSPVTLESRFTAAVETTHRIKALYDCCYGRRWTYGQLLLLSWQWNLVCGATCVITQRQAYCQCCYFFFVSAVVALKGKSYLHGCDRTTM